ncbi:MAG: methyltransferase domain-containing protein [Verrucomicrobiales bacterium]
MDLQTAAYYSQHAARLVGEYAQVETAYLEKITAVFHDCVSVLDVGCGTGRDCLYLLRSGKDAVGVDASVEMLVEARSTFQLEGIDCGDRLIEASLPELSPIKDGAFDGVLCAGVLMHLPEEEIFDAVYGLKRVLRHGGLLSVSIPEFRPGIDSESRRDESGRLFTDLPPDKLQLLFERVGFRVEDSFSNADSLGREKTSWRTMVLRRLDHASDRPLHQVEGILNRDQKVATYKLALFRALSEIAQTQPHLARFTEDQKVTIPNHAIAEKWLLYYWPIFESEFMIFQGSSSAGADVAIRTPMIPLIAHYAERGGLSAFYVEWRGGRINQEARGLVRQALRKIKSTIWTMPVRHAGGGNYEVFQYDRSEKSIVMDAKLWRELCLTGNWIQDATVLRWAELTELINRGIVKASTVIDCLLTVPDRQRNVKDARRFYADWDGRICVWTDRDLTQSFQVDHAMPFSLWRNNDLWNLFPASDRANLQKRDRLPTYDLLQRQRDSIIHCWQGLDEAFGDRFRNEAQILLGREPLVKSRWEIQIFNRFVEAFETTATQRGSDRWDPVGTNSLPDLVSTQSSGNTSQLPVPSTPTALQTKSHTPDLVPLHEVGDGAFETHLPVVASLAAGSPFHGFDVENLDWLDDVDWLEVSSNLARRDRFIVRISGRSMEPTLPRGSFVIFEWHRTPRRDREIVIANIPTFGRGQDTTEAVKRFREDPEKWVFESDNPDYDTLRFDKSETDYPILGTFVTRL